MSESKRAAPPPQPPSLRGKGEPAFSPPLVGEGPGERSASLPLPAAGWGRGRLKAQPLPRGIVIGGRADAVKVHRARELRREMTEEERILWRALRANRLQGLPFRRQQIIDGFI